MRWLLVAVSLTGMAHGQAMVEGAVAAGAAATGTAPAAGIGKAMGGMWKGVDKALGTAKPETTVTKTERKTTASEEAPAKTYDDPKGIKAGMKYEDVVERFGPAMEVTAGGQRMLTYGSLQVEVAGGKVISVETAQASVQTFALPGK